MSSPNQGEVVTGFPEITGDIYNSTLRVFTAGVRLGLWKAKHYFNIYTLLVTCNDYLSKKCLSQKKNN